MNCVAIDILLNRSAINKIKQCCRELGLNARYDLIVMPFIDMSIALLPHTFLKEIITHLTSLLVCTVFYFANPVWQFPSNLKRRNVRSYTLLQTTHIYLW